MASIEPRACSNFSTTFQRDSATETKLRKLNSASFIGHKEPKKILCKISIIICIVWFEVEGHLIGGRRDGHDSKFKTPPAQA